MQNQVNFFRSNTYPPTWVKAEKYEAVHLRFTIRHLVYFINQDGFKSSQPPLKPALCKPLIMCGHLFIISQINPDL